MSWFEIYSVIWVIVTLILLGINLRYKRMAAKEYAAAVDMKVIATAEYRKAARTMERAVELLAGVKAMKKENEP
ncbi:hypothetical protein [Arsenicibacter rosenii]|uniref:Uncharacterized protein n=1 Tax=Arsenicibacter rosenii TaxID=1750698 RepID=A0A1S2VB17_9BACT|nr:hypothetical protein [Arsenicibacter rosenii]OIN55859.1 hypothetical protein BLX24_27785 [Arsenicibacter rosenii]